MPEVSVLMPAYNRAGIIAQAIESVLTQTFSDFELLVIDDGSTDETVEVVQRYDDPRIRLVRHDVNRGQTPTRNHGLELANGRYIAMLDSDDLALPRRLERQVALLESDKTLGEVGGYIRRIDPDGRQGRVKRQPVVARDIRAQMPWRSGIFHTTVTIRADLARELRYDENLAQAQDYDLHARLLERAEIANVPEVLGCKRAHPGQVSRNLQVAHDCKKRTIERLLRGLGLEPSPDDLDRHFSLTRTDATGQAVDAAYLRWADNWLARLVEANHKRRIFPEPEFSAHAAGVRRRLGFLGLRRAPLAATRSLLGAVSTSP